MKNGNKNGVTAETSVTDTNTNTAAEVIDVAPPLVIPEPNHNLSPKDPLRMRFHVGKDYMRRLDIPNADKRKRPTQVLHLYPLLADYAGRTIPDNVNPRSHDPHCLRGAVAKQIERTLTDAPEDFFLANRGSTIIAESYSFNPQTGEIELTIADPENQGLADGATTDAVLAKVQTEAARSLLSKPDATYLELLEKGEKAESLKGGRIHLEVFVELDDRERLASLVQGRNTSRQVKGWSMSDFRGEFEWVKKQLEAPESGFTGRVGYEENADEDINILEVLALLTLFHRRYDEPDANGADTAPVVAYSSRGSLDRQLRDPEVLKGYRELAPLLTSILKLHDAVYLGYEAAYDKAFGKKSRLTRRKGVEPREHRLPITGAVAEYTLPIGFVFPVLASLRALISRRAGVIKFRVDPFKFFEKHGPALVSEFMEHFEAAGSNANEVGKRKLVYTALHSKAALALNADLHRD